MASAEVYLKSARQHFDDGDLERAIALCRTALVVHPDAGRLWELCGTACWARGDMPAALEALEAASALVALSPLAQLALASAYAWADKPDLARTVYCHLTELPGFPVPLMPRLAAELGRLGEDEAALLVCERIIELRPGYHTAWFGLAFYRRRLGRGWGEVIAALKVARDLAPERLTYRLSLAACLAQAGDFERAYQQAREVPLEAVSCPSWLGLMEGVFAVNGDEERAAGCRCRLQALVGAEQREPDE